jgi:hypothetical protein
VAGEGRRLATVQWRPGMGRPTLRLILASLVLAQMEEVTGAVRHLAGQSPQRRGLLLGRSVPFGLAPVLKPIGRGFRGLFWIVLADHVVPFASRPNHSRGHL